MLKRLELVGFKSFADKTTFKFGDGITAIVGPNGSGKSNIVDAVRWILGEQSAKSLRGGEMADVIFNGSASRRSFGMAEVTMTFDNTRKTLSFDGDEVQITRRVYRNGEGEYLINQQICRLRDIKELFLGSGAGQNAYSIIEQGRVDVMLQASTKERRIIFEEAAGISRFKAKKIETQRKLLRVDQNLQRLQDIVDEVEKQLRSVKLQASKAQRYQEYSEQLKTLRVGLALREYREVTTKIETESASLSELRRELEERAERARACETDTQQIDQLLNDLEDSLQTEQARLAHVRQEINSQQTTLGYETSLSAELQAEVGELRAQWSQIVGRISGLEETVSQAWQELQQAETYAEQERDQVKSFEEKLENTKTQLQQWRQQQETDKNAHMDNMRRAAHLQNDAVACKAQIDNLERERGRLQMKTEQAAENLASVDVELQELQQAEAALQARLDDSRQTLTDQRNEQTRLRSQRDELAERVSELRQQRSGVASRIEVLQGLMKSHEGLGTGVAELCELLERDDPGLWQSVLGMIADFITVRHEHAPLIDLALGDWAQRFLVRDVEQLRQALVEREEPFSGRVSFVPIHQASVSAESNGVALENGATATATVTPLRSTAVNVTHLLSLPGVVASAPQWVWCDDPELAHIPEQLLGDTIIVDDLEAAFALAVQHRHVRFLTMQGELLTANGALTVGTFHAETGILSRKSELRELQNQVRELDVQIGEAGAELAETRQRVTDIDALTMEQQSQLDVLTEQIADLRSRVERHRDERDGLHEEVALQRDESQRIDQETATLKEAFAKAREQAAEAENLVEQLHEKMQATEQAIQRSEEERHERQQQCTLAHVSLAKAEERLGALSVQHEQLESDLELRQREIRQLEQRIQSNAGRKAASQQAMLLASSKLAEAYSQKETAQLRVGELQSDRDAKRRLRTQLTEQAQAVRRDWQDQQEQVHARELQVNELQHRSNTLVERLRDEYEIDLAELHEASQTAETESNEASVESAAEDAPDESAAEDAPDESADPEAVLYDPEEAARQIDELRRKLSRLGSVNMEALEELQELEERATNLNAQHADLTSAKQSLEEIITKINKDSRRMFTETFETVRGHFQELFRKMFGGGMADVVVEDETDILESGIEIIARPPGKELRSISLMSGGEKTMTAVALLLAIFRSKPSPFCILDEVDAALDEANIGRFTSVLREFLDRSQFILVTHSKKTMATADVLYGITMQESGISKQVSVRFDDWPDDPEEAADPANHLGSFGGK